MSSNEPSLKEAWHQGQTTWPAIRLTEDVFAAHLARHARRREGQGPLRLLDLYLACACTQQDPEALRELRRHYFPRAARAVAKLRAGRDLESEVLQLLWEQLVLPRADDAPRIAEYTGEGPLAAWLCACAVRLAQMELRAVRREAELDESSEDALAREVAEDNPELEMLRARFKADFVLCFGRALETLPVRERNLLRLSLVDKLSIDALAPLYGTHRATAARWLTKARAALLEQVRVELKAHLRVESATLESLYRAAGSAMDLSLRQLFANSP